MELLDEVQIKASNMASGKNLPEVPTLMFEFIGTGNCSSSICFTCAESSILLHLFILGVELIAVK